VLFCSLLVHIHKFDDDMQRPAILFNSHEDTTTSLFKDDIVGAVRFDVSCKDIALLWSVYGS